MKNKIIGWTLIGIGAVGMALLISLLFSIPVWLLWNWLMPVIFGLKVITIWQAWGISVLSGLLFRSVSVNTPK